MSSNVNLLKIYIATSYPSGTAKAEQAWDVAQREFIRRDRIYPSLTIHLGYGVLTRSWLSKTPNVPNR
ncbi:MAG: hypothetical protein QNJ63_00740, partial [Calothrix sp. MO_192.B10]|nr:hypothetical protein [Calothrix sp. MO_192.B10]